MSAHDHDYHQGPLVLQNQPDDAQTKIVYIACVAMAILLAGTLGALYIYHQMTVDKQRDQAAAEQHLKDQAAKPAVNAEQLEKVNQALGQP